MIISHKHRLIFLHCPKAAGSSVTVSLSRYLGPGDVQLGSYPDAARFGIRPPRKMVLQAIGGLRPAELAKVVGEPASSWRWLNKAAKRRYSRRLGGKAAHATAAEIAAAFPDEWRRYRKFCVVRNPWDRAVSQYFWRARYVEDPPTFESYLAALSDGHDLGGFVPPHHSSWDIYTIDDRVAVDRVVRFESLQQDLAEILEDTSLDWDGWVPHSKPRDASEPENAEPNRSYRRHYSDAGVEIVRRLYWREIEEFGYAF